MPTATRTPKGIWVYRSIFALPPCTKANRCFKKFLVFGGTSVAAPVGGILGNNGGSVNAASTIYANSSALFDVTSGTNGSCSPAYLCTGEAGYDGPTGLGTPNGMTAFGK